MYGLSGRNNAQPFESAEDALENCNDISEGILSNTLKLFLEVNIPSVKKLKDSSITLGVVRSVGCHHDQIDAKIGQAIQEELKIPCMTNDVVVELCRGIRQHYSRFIPSLSNGAAEKAMLGLGHSYSRAHVKFNVNREDNMIIQAICLLDQVGILSRRDSSSTRT